MAADADDPERQLLEGALLGRVFPEMQEILAGAANSSTSTRGYDGSRRMPSLWIRRGCLCLDELILWFAQHATEHAFSIVRLRRSCSLWNRIRASAPCRSPFVARQRDLGELISTSVPNFTGSHYHQMLKMHEGKMAASSSCLTQIWRSLPANDC